MKMLGRLKYFIQDTLTLNQSFEPPK